MDKVIANVVKEASVERREETLAEEDLDLVRRESAVVAREVFMHR